MIGAKDTRTNKGFMWDVVARVERWWSLLVADPDPLRKRISSIKLTDEMTRPGIPPNQNQIHSFLRVS